MRSYSREDVLLRRELLWRGFFSRWAVNRPQIPILKQMFLEN